MRNRVHVRFNGSPRLEGLYSKDFEEFVDAILVLHGELPDAKVTWPLRVQLTEEKAWPLLSVGLPSANITQLLNKV